MTEIVNLNQRRVRSLVNSPEAMTFQGILDMWRAHILELDTYFNSGDLEKEKYYELKMLALASVVRLELEKEIWKTLVEH